MLKRCLACGETILPDEPTIDVWRNHEQGKAHDELACNFDVRTCACGNKFLPIGDESVCDVCFEETVF